MGNINPEILELLNLQFSAENYNSNLYNVFGNFLRVMGLDNIAKFFIEDQVVEERKHQQGIADYINSRDCVLTSPVVPAVEVELTDVLQIAELFLAAERDTTAKLTNIAKKCLEVGDLVTFGFIQEMIAKQINEEDEALSFLNRAQLAGNDSHALLLWDAGFYK